MKYLTTIGLECTCNLKTQSKMFCAAATGYGASAETHRVPVCWAIPGHARHERGAAIR